MRKLIVDTDTGSDDAVALLMALRDPQVDLLALTTVSGNVPLEQATLNCMMTAEVSGRKPLPPVYMGADRPLMRERVHAHNVHGQDGMGDCGLIHPQMKPQEGEHAADAIIRLVGENPGEVELAVIGPATNIALAMMKAPEIMKKTKAIWTMGTNGFGPGNTTPVSEFNVYADAEAYRVMLDFGVPVTIVGYDMCVGETAWTAEDTARLLANGSEVAQYAVRINSKLREYSMAHCGQDLIDVCDAVALGCMLWPEVIKGTAACVSHVCTGEPETYGQVILYDGHLLAGMRGFENRPYGKSEPNCTVVTAVDGVLYKQKLEKLLCE